MWCWIGNVIVIENLCSQENMLRYLWRTLIKLPRPRFLCACVTCLIRLEISHKLWSIYCVFHSKVHFLSFFSFLFFTHLFFGYESSYCSFLVSYVLTLDFCHTYAAERGPSFKAWWEDATRPLSQGWYEHIENTVKCSLTFHMLFTHGCPMQLNLLVWQRFSAPPPPCIEIIAFCSYESWHSDSENSCQGLPCFDWFL
jgi:hypothetical protein